MLNGPKQRVIIERGHSLQHGQPQRSTGWPGPAMNPLGPVQAVDRFNQGVVAAVALAAHRGLNASFREPLAVADASTLGGA